MLIKLSTRREVDEFFARHPSERILVGRFPEHDDGTVIMVFKARDESVYFATTAAFADRIAANVHPMSTFGDGNDYEDVERRAQVAELERMVRPEEGAS